MRDLTQTTAPASWVPPRILAAGVLCTVPASFYTGYILLGGLSSFQRTMLLASLALIGGLTGAIFVDERPGMDYRLRIPPHWRAAASAKPAQAFSSEAISNPAKFCDLALDLAADADRVAMIAIEGWDAQARQAAQVAEFAAALTPAAAAADQAASALAEVSEAVKAVTGHARAATNDVIRASESCFAAQRSIDRVSSQAGPIQDAADAIREVYLKLETEAAGASDLSTAELAQRIHHLARAGSTAITALLLGFVDMRDNTADVSNHIAEIGNAIQRQHTHGMGIARAVAEYGVKITAVLKGLSDTRNGMSALRHSVDQIAAVGNARFEPSGMTVESRLPAQTYSDRMALLLRGLPDFSTALD